MRERKGVLGVVVLGLAVLVCASLAAEDLYIEQAMQMTGVPGQGPMTMNQKMWVSGNKMKMEMSGGQMMAGMGKVIMRGDQQKVYMINDAQRTYMEMPLSQMTGMAMPMMQQMQVDVQKTGQKRKIGQWDCEQYIITATGGTEQMPLKMKLDLWVTDQVKYDEAAKQQMQEAVNKNPMMKPLMDKMKDIDGLPIEQTIEMNMMGNVMTTKMNVTTVRQAPIPASTFELPAGYTKQAMPQMPAGGGAPQQ